MTTTRRTCSAVRLESVCAGQSSRRATRWYAAVGVRKSSTARSSEPGDEGAFRPSLRYEAARTWNWLALNGAQHCSPAGAPPLPSGGKKLSLPSSKSDSSLRSSSRLLCTSCATRRPVALHDLSLSRDGGGSGFGAVFGSCCVSLLPPRSSYLFAMIGSSS